MQHHYLIVGLVSTVVFTPFDDSLKVMSTCYLSILYPNSTFQTIGRATPYQKYIRGRVLCQAGLLMRPERSETKAKTETRECETEIETETETKNLL